MSNCKMATVSNVLLCLVTFTLISHFEIKAYNLSVECNETRAVDLDVTVDGVQYYLPQYECQPCPETCFQLYQIINTTRWSRGCVRVSSRDDVDENNPN